MNTTAAKKALLEMQRLGLLEVIKEIVQENKAFRNALGNWSEKTDLTFLFDLMDLGMPVGRGLSFLSKPEQERVREITVDMDAAEGRKFVTILEQPGQVISTPALMEEFNLKGPQVRQIMLTARALLLDRPELAQDAAKWEGLVRDQLRQVLKTAAWAPSKTPLRRSGISRSWDAFAKSHRKNFWYLPYTVAANGEMIEDQLKRMYVRYWTEDPTTADVTLGVFLRGHEEFLRKRGEANQRALDNAGDQEALLGRLMAGTASAEDVREIGKLWSKDNVYTSDTRRAKDTVKRRILELARRHHWMSGYGVDKRVTKYPYILYVDTPFGQVAFHEQLPSVHREYPGEWDRKHATWERAAKVLERYGLKDGGGGATMESRVASRYLQGGVGMDKQSSVRQALLHVTGSPSITPCPKKPDRVWTILRDKHPRLPFTPIFEVNAFPEDQIHDWKWSQGNLRYFSRITTENQPRWLLLEFGKEEPKMCPKCDKDFPAGSNFCPDCGVKLVSKVASRYLCTAAAEEVVDSNLKGVVEVPRNTFPVEVLPPKKKRKKWPFEGFIDFQGLEIDVENDKGSVRSGVSEDGTPWAVEMFWPYGEIRGTEGVDAPDALDAYVGPNHDSSLVVVIHQHDPDTGKYDEDKVMLGFDSTEEAIGAYKKQYSKPGFYVEGEYTEMPIGQFWRWVHDDKNRGKKVKARVQRIASRWLREDSFAE